MENLANYIFLGSLLGICILTLRIIRRRDNSEARDPGEAIVEFGNVFPKEAIRGVLMDKTGLSTFMRLANGKTGLVQVVGNTYAVRLIEAGQVGVETADSDDALILNFEDDSAIGGEYHFSSPEDAAEVSLWICGSFSQTMADVLDSTSKS